MIKFYNSVKYIKYADTSKKLSKAIEYKNLEKVVKNNI